MFIAIILGGNDGVGTACNQTGKTCPAGLLRPYFEFGLYSALKATTCSGRAFSLKIIIQIVVFHLSNLDMCIDIVAAPWNHASCSFTESMKQSRVLITGTGPWFMVLYRECVYFRLQPTHPRGRSSIVRWQ